jgi:hypothetical protein
LLCGTPLVDLGESDLGAVDSRGGEVGWRDAPAFDRVIVFLRIGLAVTDVDRGQLGHLVIGIGLCGLIGGGEVVHVHLAVQIVGSTGVVLSGQPLGRGDAV